MVHDPPPLSGVLGAASTRAVGRAQTKIVATIGPASEGRLPELIEAGLSVARLNFSHGEADEHRRRPDVIRKAARDTGRPIAILADIQGPKLRMGRFVESPVLLEEGDRIRIQQGDGTAQCHYRHGR